MKVKNREFVKGMGLGVIASLFLSMLLHSPKIRAAYLDPLIQFGVAIVNSNGLEKWRIETVSKTDDSLRLLNSQSSAYVVLVDTQNSNVQMQAGSYFLPTSTNTATLSAVAPALQGLLAYNITSGTLCISTGTATNAWAQVNSTTTACK